MTGETFSWLLSTDMTRAARRDQPGAGARCGCERRLHRFLVEQLDIDDERFRLSIRPPRLGQDDQPFGDKQAGFAPLFSPVEAAQELDQRILGQLDHVHGGGRSLARVTALVRPFMLSVMNITPENPSSDIGVPA